MTVATRREHEQQMRRETIIEAARRLFRDKGFDLTTVEEIASLAELGKGTIYSYFKSKDEIYFAILESEFDILLSRMKQVILDFTTAENTLNKLYDTFIQYNRERRGLIKAIFLQIEQQPSLRMREIVLRLKEKTGEWVKLIADVLQKGIERGEFKGFSVERMANSVVGLIIGLVFQSELGQIKEDLTNYRDSVNHLIFGSIL